MAWCDASQVRDLLYSEALLGSWSLAVLTGLVLQATRRRSGRNGWVSAGFAVMTVPAWMVILSVFPDWIRIFCEQGDLGIVVAGPAPLPPPSWHFSNIAASQVLRNAGYVLLGALIVAHGADRTLWKAPRVPRIAAALRGLVPLGRSEGASLRLGVAVFPVLALANLGLAALADPRTADSYYTNMTPYHAVFLALAAAFGEELVYRGVMQQGILRLLWPRLGFTPAAGVAIIAQAIPFAFAHAGYNDYALLGFAFLFALMAGIATQAFGIWTAIALHALIDFYVFYLAVPEPGIEFTALVGVVSVAVLGVAVWEAIRRLRGAQPRNSA